jgi:uncharacterized membrane protein
MDANKSIGWILRIGAIISILLILFGMFLLFINNGGSNYTLTQITSHKSKLSTANISTTQIINGISSLDGISYIILGLIVLIATPVLRVLYSVYFFARENNKLYVFITAIVLLDLLIAIFVIPFIMKSL